MVFLRNTALKRWAIGAGLLAGLAAFHDDGSAAPQVQTPPFSDLASAEAEQDWKEQVAAQARWKQAIAAAKIDVDKDPQALRAIIEEVVGRPERDRLLAAFAVRIESSTLAGVKVHVVTPAEGVPSEKAGRVLINLHGGHMMVGDGRAEAIPISSLGRYKVVAIDYRLAPEHRFPAASEDVARVYRELLKTYPPEAIGIYGCSSGADLTAQSLAWFQKTGLPRPGAAGLFGSGAGIHDRWGDSFVMDRLFKAQPVPPRRGFDSAYLKGADGRSPLVVPAYHGDVLARFPPTLLLTGTRDVGMSVTVYSHARLVAAGADADLHVLEGVSHCSLNPAVPEVRHGWRTVVKFFDKSLERSSRMRRAAIDTSQVRP